MISVLLVIKLTVVLGVGALSLGAPRVLTPAARHFLCLLALTLSLLLPIAPSTGSLPVPPLFSYISSSSSAVVPAHQGSAFWIRLVWMAGALFVGVRCAFGLLWMWRRASSATPLRGLPPSLQSLCDDLHVRVKIAPVSTPLVWGWFHPEILLPESAPGWPPDRLKLALLHELAHISRRDLWTSLIVAAARALYWFHPLVWWLAAQASKYQELACDDRVLAAGAPCEEYAALLIDTARGLTSTLLFGCPMVGRSNSLRGRIMHILQFRSHSRVTRSTRGATFVFSVLLLSAALAVPAAVDHPAQTNSEPVYKIGGEISAPVLVSKIEPAYTDAARKAKISGPVLLSVVIDSSGMPRDVQVTRGLGWGLDESAIAAVTEWRFTPGRKNGKPVAVRANIEVNFRLK